MKKKRLIILGVFLLSIAILVLVSGPILKTLGVEVFCISNDGGGIRLERCYFIGVISLFYKFLPWGWPKRVLNLSQ